MAVGADVGTSVDVETAVGVAVEAHAVTSKTSTASAASVI
jgi:hypothetical protein